MRDGEVQVRGPFRIQSTSDLVVRDVARAAGVARSQARRLGIGLCTPEPLEDDPMGLVLDLLDLEVPLSQLEHVVDRVAFERSSRRLTRQEIRPER